MRRFVDLHLKPTSESELAKMLELSAEMGYGAVAVALDDLGASTARKLCMELGIGLVSRIDLKPKSESELTTSLSRLRRRFEIVSVECASKAVARQAAKDHRVDILDFPPSPQNRSRVWFDRQAATLAKESKCAYEINASDMFSQGPALAARLLSVIRDEVENARKSSIPIVLSSGAESALQLRDPLGLAALTDLFEVPEERGLDMISADPWRIVEENRRKLSPEFVVPGVRLEKGHAG